MTPAAPAQLSAPARLTAAAAVLLSVTALSPAAATTTDDQAQQPHYTWGVVPAPPQEGEGQEGDAQEDAPARVSFRMEVEPGQSLRDAIEVQNFSDEELTFALTASDGIVTPEGVFDILPADAIPEDVGAWITIDDTVTVPAQDSAVVPFILQVPADALPGDHPGGITASVESSSADGAVALDARVGVRIHLRVAGDIEAGVQLQDVTTTYTTHWNPFAPGTLTLDYTVANSGNVRVGSTQRVAVDGPLGISAGGSPTAVAEQREVLPRQESRQSVSVPAWPLGSLTARLTAAQNVVGEDELPTPPGVTTEEEKVTAVPWPQLIVLALLVLIALVWRSRRAAGKRKLDAALEKARAEGRAEASGGSTAASGETGESSESGEGSSAVQQPQA